MLFLFKAPLISGIFQPCLITEGKSSISGRVFHDKPYYSLVMTNIANWKITIFNGQIHYKWSFFIAMLHYQRVNHLIILGEYWFTSALRDVFVFVIARNARRKIGCWTVAWVAPWRRTWVSFWFYYRLSIDHPYINHISTIYQPYINHILTIWRQHAQIIHVWHIC